MEGLVRGSLIDGVALQPLVPHPDSRGSFIEVFADHWHTDIKPAQWSVVHSHAGVLRGMHFHLRHAEYFTVVAGRAFVGLYDARPGAPTEGENAMYDLSSEQPAFLTFPPGVIHGWLFPEPSVHLQAVTEASDFYAEDDNLGCHWSDADLGIDWPVQPTIVSERADAFPPLAELLSRLPR